MAVSESEEARQTIYACSLNACSKKSKWRWVKEWGVISNHFFSIPSRVEVISLHVKSFESVIGSYLKAHIWRHMKAQIGIWNHMNAQSAHKVAHIWSQMKAQSSHMKSYSMIIRSPHITAPQKTIQKYWLPTWSNIWIFEHIDLKSRETKA